MNKRQIPKVKAIIRTLLLTTGPKSAREISEFIDFNNFNLCVKREVKVLWLLIG